MWRLTKSFADGDILQESNEGNNDETRSKIGAHVEEAKGGVILGVTEGWSFHFREAGGNVSCKK